MEMLEGKTDYELTRSLLGEIAKCRNEISCASGDIAKAQGRLGFLLVLVNTLIDRQIAREDDLK